jgi:hypothetical protein
MAAQRRFLVVMTVLAIAGAVLQAVTGDTALVLHLTPLFLIGGLVLAGRFVGEDRIVALRRGAIALARARRVRTRWRHRAEQALASLLERSPRLLRGPPASFAAAA